MSLSKIKKTKSGTICVDFEYRKIHPVTKQKCYQSKRVILDASLTPAKQQKQAELLHAKFIEECESLYKIGFEFNSYTLSDFIKVYLEYQKSNCAALTHYRNCQASVYVDEQLGHFKLKDLNPENIQEFFNKVNKLQKHQVQVFPLDSFNKTLELNSLDYHKLRYEMNVQHFTLRRVMDGKPTTRKWSEDFAKKINIPFDKLFRIEEAWVPLAYNSKKKYTSFLKACLSEAKKKRLIVENYALASYVTPIKNPTPNKQTNCMNKEEFFKLYTTIENWPDIRMKTAVSLLLNTGIRKEELIGLKWENVHFKDNYISIENTVVYVPTIGLVKNDYKTKNQSSNRRLPVSNELMILLQDYKDYCHSKYSNPDYLFLQQDGKEVLNPSTVNSWLDKILDAAELPHYTVHSIRHSYASIMLEKVPMIAVSKRIGHSRVSTTSDIYGHVVTNKDKTMADLESFINEEDGYSELKSQLLNLYRYGILSEEEYNEKIQRLNLLISQNKMN